MSDVELIASLLDLGSLGPAAALVDRFGSLARIERAGIAELVSVPAIDRAGAERIQAALALGRRLAAERAGSDEPLRTPGAVWRRFGPRLAGELREHFWAVALDSRLRVLAEREIAVGWSTGVEFQARDAFRVLVAESAVSALFVHNHPSGDPAPSEHDRTLTARLCEAGTLLGIRVIDHVVVAEGGFASALPRPAPEATL